MKKIKYIKNPPSYKDVSYKAPCFYCKSPNVVKYGKRKTKIAIKQLYHCNKCKRKFIEEKDFERIKGGEKITGVILDLYFRGLSLRSIEDHLLKAYKINLRHTSVLRRIKKFENEFKRKNPDYRRLAKKRDKV